MLVSLAPGIQAAKPPTLLGHVATGCLSAGGEPLQERALAMR